MQAIWKECFELGDKVSIMMPKDSEILCVQTQNNKPCVWFKVRDVNEIKKEVRNFFIYGTGHQHQFIYGEYVGTFQLFGGDIVFHMFEEC